MTFSESFKATFQAIVHDSAVLAIVALAAILYSFYYPAAYSAQVVTQLPVAVVDLDNSAMSRMLIRKVAATQGASVQYRLHSFTEAKTLLAEDKIDGFMLITKGFERDIMKGEQGQVALYANGAYTLKAKAVLVNFGAAIRDMQTVAAGRQTLARGTPPAQPGIALVQRPLFNTREGYGSVVIPGIVILIIQQTLLLGIALILGTRRQENQPHYSTPGFFGAMSAFGLIGLVNSLYLFGFVYWFQDYPLNGSFINMFIAAMFLLGAVLTFSMYVGSFFTRRERALQVLLGTSLPIFFLGGLSWPLHAYPFLLRVLGMMIPSTPGTQAMMKVNQLGANLSEIKMELLVFTAMIIIYGFLAWRRNCRPGPSNIEKAA